MGSISNWLYKMCEWIMRLAYINLLWIGFSLLGLLLFGIGPATSSMFTVVRQWLRNKKDVRVFRTFWYSYKKDFWRTNVLFWLLSGGGFLLYIDFLFIGNLTGWFTPIFSGILLLLTLLYMVVVVYIFPVFVHFDLKTIQNIKYALLLGFSSPLSLLIIVACTLFMYYLIVLIPAAFPFFSGSVISYVIMKRANATYNRLEDKYITPEVNQ